MGCRRRVPWEHQARHLLECNKYRCPSCYVIVERDQLTEHQQVCAKMKCQVCKESLYKTEEDLHLAQCRGPRMEGWGPSQKSCSLPRLDPSQVTNIILASATKYPMPQGCMFTEKVHLLPNGNHRGMWVNLVHKFYTGDLDDTTEGLTCHEIAELID
jgi:hypothetical protein